MSEKTDIQHQVSTGPMGVDDAVGVPKMKWFVAIVTSRHEKKEAELLTKMGIENYLPIQTRWKIWKNGDRPNGKKVKVDYVVISCVIFVHCTEQQRHEILSHPYVKRFMTNKSGTSASGLNKPLAIVSDEEINRLKFMLGQSDVPVEVAEHTYSVGEKVRVVRGGLAGIEGKVVNLNSPKSELTVALELFGSAKLTIDTINLELIKA